LGQEDRLAAIFVVSRVTGVPEAIEFLAGVSGQANMEHIFAQEGLRLLEGTR
jgi:hypothetical protein